MASPKSNDDIKRALSIAATRRKMESTLVADSPIYAQLVQMMSQLYGKSGRDGGLTQRERIAAALATAVFAGPESAIEWTVTRALNHGMKAQAVRDAIDVALLNGGTFTVARSRFAYNALALRLKQKAGSKPLVLRGVASQ